MWFSCIHCPILISTNGSYEDNAFSASKADCYSELQHGFILEPVIFLNEKFKSSPNNRANNIKNDSISLKPSVFQHSSMFCQTSDWKEASTKCKKTKGHPVRIGSITVICSDTVYKTSGRNLEVCCSDTYLA